MFKNKTVMIAGGGGFIGGHLTKRLLTHNNVIAVDIKPLNKWFQKFPSSKNYSLDLKNKSNCIKVTKNVDFVFNLACNMGGMGFIENNKAECMLSVLINTNLLEASKINKVSKFFFASFGLMPVDPEAGATSSKLTCQCITPVCNAMQ